LEPNTAADGVVMMDVDHHHHQKFGGITHDYKHKQCHTDTRARARAAARTPRAAHARIVHIMNSKFEQMMVVGYLTNINEQMQKTW